MNLSFRTLGASEIEARIAQIKENGLTLLLYKDARCDMNILDETVGAMNWQRAHVRDNANCIVSIWDTDKEQWVSKEDTGTESYTEKEKGQASDSFKRACFNWGIGRELYTAPFIWVSSKDCNISKQGNTFKCYDKFKVKSISYDERRNISSLIIENTNTKRIAFAMGSSQKAASTTTQVTPVATANSKKQGEITEAEVKALYELGNKVGKTPNGIVNTIKKDFGIVNPLDMTKSQYAEIYKKLESLGGKK
ncbi:MAG: hypothetical protein ACI33J_08090 [Clostridium sp.]